MQTKLTVKVFNSLLILGLIFSIFSAAAPTAAKPIDEQSLEKVESRVLNTLSTDGTSSFVIEIAEKADLSKAYAITDWSERGWYVYNTLREVASRTQKPILEILKKRGLNYESFFAANEIVVKDANFNTLSEIAALQAVGYIRFPQTIYLDPNFISIQKTSVTQATINSLAWGIADTNADDFWSEFDTQGDGLVVANIDTGVQWDHPALDQAYKCGTNPSDPACWADPANICGGSACDNNGHGTHTMGTMVGDDDPTLAYQVGMAPNARWIACKGCENKDCSEASLNACADWVLAPAGNPDNRPHIVNNSWGGGGGDAWYLAKVNAWRAAGIFPAFSAANSGPACGSIGSPGDYQESFSTANHMSGKDISSSSSRGPSTYGDNPYTKPNISAPGTNICSCVPGNSWSCLYSGTSMASPHVAGAVALLWSCNPSLIGNMTTTFELLQDTADPPTDSGNCSAPMDGEGNFTYGYGYLNVLAAGLQVCPTCVLSGTVTDGNTPVEAATVTAENGTGLYLNTLTIADGTYTLHLPENTYTVSATKFGYSEDIETEVEVLVDGTPPVDFIIYPLLSVIPTELEQTQLADTVTDQSLTIVNPSDSAVAFELLKPPEDSLLLENVELNIEAESDIPWLLLDPIAGVILADDSMDVTVTFDSNGLAEGDYFATIRVNNSPAAAINVPVTLHVTETIPLTITADDKDKIKGDPDPVLTYQITSGSLAGDDGITGELTRDPGEDVGSYEILIGSLEIDDGNNGDNYALTFVKGIFTIEQGTFNLYLPLMLK